MDGEKKKRLRTMDDVPLDGKRVLVRVDFNVVTGDNGKVDPWESYRIEAALPTIEELRQRRCKVLLLPHRGRPGDPAEKTDMGPVKKRLEDLLHDDVKSVDQLYGSKLSAIVDGMEHGGVVMLPNVRSDEREESGNEKFARQISESADAYVNEAFSVCHRSHVSVSFVPRLIPSCAGRRVVQEVERLGVLKDNPEQPYVAIISGSKIETKIGLFYRLLPKVEKICVGGKLANLLLVAQGVYKEEFPPDDVAVAKSLLEKGGDKIVLPVDVVVGSEDGLDGVRAIGVDDVPEDAKVYDIGPRTADLFLVATRMAKTVMWNGPVGVFEVPVYARSTQAIAQGLAKMDSNRVVGGGDTVTAIDRLKLRDQFDFVSTGGGAMISFLGGEAMPGLEALSAQ